MINRSGRVARERVIGAVLMVMLALIAAVLVVAALQTPDVAGSGSAPAPAHTWDPSTPVQTTEIPTPTPTPTVGVGDPPPGFVDFSDEKNGLRSTQGGCSGTDAVVESTSDGGITWAPIQFGGALIRQVLSIESLTPDEATIIALEGSSCTATVMATYTGGAFWQSYPDRLAGELYFDPATPAIVNVRGTAIAGPCSAMDQVVETSTGLVALCTEGLFVYSNATTTWALLSAVPALVVSVDSQTGTLFAGIRDVPGCPGIGLRSYGLQQAPDDGIDVSCLNVNMPSAVGLSASGGATWFWDGHSLSKSLDGARSWVDAS